MSITFDSYAWIEYFSGSRKGARVKEFIDGEGQIFTPSLCLMEIKSKYMREKKPHAEQIEFICSRSSIVEINKEIALAASDIKESEALPGVDALIYAAAKSRRTKLLAGDRHFYGKKDIEFLE